MAQLTEIRTLELEPLEPAAVLETPPRWYDPYVLAARIRARRWYILFVALPTLVASGYLGLFAADRYEAEALFVVRSPGSSAAGQFTSLIQKSGIGRSSDDSYIVLAYMQSRDAVAALAASSDLMQRLQRPQADLLWRYPGPVFSHSAERLWRHFQSFISVDYDSSTGITKLRVQAFTPEDAHAIADALLARSERLINTISERAQQETLRSASSEVEATRDRAKAALQQVSAFRKRYEIIDPGRVSTTALETITRLAVEIARANADLSELRLVTADSPQAKTLSRRIVAFEEQIGKEKRALAGSDTSLAPLIAEYERLILEREFAERSFASAQAARDIARIEVERQRLFIERISAPSIPDYPKYPSRLLGILGVFLVARMLYAIGRRVGSDTRSHAGN